MQNEPLKQPQFLTFVELFERKPHQNDRLLFGRPICRDCIERRTRLWFSKSQIFGLVGWRGDGYGTQTWRVVVAQAGGPGERLTRISGVKPGAHLLLHAFGKARAKRALRAIDMLSDSHVLYEIAPAYWRHVHVQITRNEPPEPYDAQAFAGMARARLVS